MSRRQSREVLESIAANVRRYRARRGLTQEGLAERADIGLRYLQSVERGTKNIGVLVLVAVASALGVAPSILLRRAKLPPAKRGRPRHRRP